MSVSLRAVGEAAVAAGPRVDVALDQARDQAALAAMAWAIHGLSPDRPAEAPASPRLTDHSTPVVGRWLEELTAAGRLEKRDGALAWRQAPPGVDDMRAAWARAINLAPEAGSGGALTRFFLRCSLELPRVLAGEVSVQALLFDDPTVAEEIYQANEASRYTNTVAATHIARRCADIAASGRTPTVLEVGAGIGGTTDLVIDALRELPVRYHFTDVGDAFLTAAHDRWAGRSGLTTGIYDINAGEAARREALGNLAGSIDVVLAANVMHNAVAVPDALRFLAETTRPGGDLVLIETGTEHLPLLVSMRFLMSPPPPGPGVGGDRAERGRILLSSPEWSHAIDGSPWCLDEVLPGPESTHDITRYDQHVWLAHSPATHVNR